MRALILTKLPMVAATLLTATALPLAAQEQPPLRGAHHMAGPGAGDPHGSCGMRAHPVGKITVTGTGEANVAPDTAMIALGVTTQADSAAAAMSANSEQQAAVIAALGEQGIEDRDIQTSGLNLSPLMNYPEGGSPQVTGYQAQNMVTVRVRDLAALGGTLDAIVGAGANEMNGISFQIEDPQAASDTAKGDAIDDARHSAKVLAEAAGVPLGPIIAIRETVQNGGPQPMMMARDAKAGASVPIQAGELAVSAQVQVDFALPYAGGGANCEGPDAGPMPGDAGPADAGPADAGPDPVAPMPPTEPMMPADQAAPDAMAPTPPASIDGGAMPAPGEAPSGMETAPGQPMQSPSTDTPADPAAGAAPAPEAGSPAPAN